MGTKQIRVSEEFHARVQAENQEGETLGETLERLLNDYTLTDFADDMAEVADEHPSVDELERSIEESDERNRKELEKQLP